MVANRLCFRRSVKMHLDIFKFREGAPRICVAKTKKQKQNKKKKTFQRPHIMYRDMASAKMLPGNRTFRWERTQVTHLSGMPMLRALEFHY